MNEFGRNVFGGVFLRNIGFLSHSLICWKNTKELTARFGLLNWNKNHMVDYFKRLNHEYYDQQEDYATTGNELDVILIKKLFCFLCPSRNKYLIQIFAFWCLSIFILCLWFFSFSKQAIPIQGYGLNLCWSVCAVMFLHQERKSIFW